MIGGCKFGIVKLSEGTLMTNLVDSRVVRMNKRGSTSNEFRMDWLFSYRPTPGTLFYLGYGSTLEEPEEFRFRDLQRRVDGFFAKASYLFRI